MADKKGAASPLERVDAGWQRIEARLCAAVLVAEIASLTLWISLKGLSADFRPGENASGLVYRCFLTAAVMGVVAHLATRRAAARVHTNLTTAAVIVGLMLGRVWVHVGVTWSGNVLNWLQNASTLMLIGGLRGLATRLTLWVALLGASLATSRGKHIHVDVLVRYVPVKLRVPTALAGQIAAAVVCIFGAIGFVDYISISVFRANATEPCPDDKNKTCDTTPGEKAAAVEHALGQDFFLLGRQATLDLRSLPKVLAGTPYDKWMTAGEWNTWLDGADWKAHFDATAVDALHMDPSQPNATRMPQVAVPGTGEEARALLVRELDFVFPFGLAIIALKFLLRIVLILQGRINVDPDSAHDDPELSRAEERDAAAAKGVAS
ncbi:MAG TPA: TRAP transporter small permease subunit [Polyangiaceae bacterium]